MNQDIYVVIEHLRGQVADISYVMLPGRVLTTATGGKLVAVLLGYETASMAEDLAADSVLFAEHPQLADFTPDTYKIVLAEIVRSHEPRAVLLGDTSIGAEVAGGLSVRLGLPLVSHCQTFAIENGTPTFISQLCGGKIMAEGLLPNETALVLMVPGGYKPEQGRGHQPPAITPLTIPPLNNLCVTLKEYIEPLGEDIDISKAPILIAVGRGIQREDNLELVQELAEALGGQVCASRPVVDQGWLPTTRLVGKSGKMVKPRLYLALGISGAPEHVEGVGVQDLLVAINTDPTAPIFDVANYGAELDILDILPVLTDKVQDAKGRG